MTGLPTRLSVRFTVATSSSNESRPYWTAMTSCPSACNAGITLLKHEPSAQMPWQNTMVGLDAVDILHSPSLISAGRYTSLLSTTKTLYVRPMPGRYSEDPDGTP